MATPSRLGWTDAQNIQLLRLVTHTVNTWTTNDNADAVSILDYLTNGFYNIWASKNTANSMANRAASPVDITSSSAGNHYGAGSTQVPTWGAQGPYCPPTLVPVGFLSSANSSDNRKESGDAVPQQGV